MTPIYVPLEMLTQECTWEVNGQSPQHSPQAFIQFASQVLVPMSANPQAGIDPNALATSLVEQAGFANLKGIVLTPDELKQKQIETIQAAIQQQQQSAPGQSPGGMVGQSPPSGVPGIPPPQAAPGGAQPA